MPRLPSGVLIGEQRPRLLRASRAPLSDNWRDFVDLGRAYGTVADEWQETTLQVWTGERVPGLWATTRSGLSVPRQNGKNGGLEIRELGGLILLRERILHTAHEVKTSLMHFTRMKAYFENFDDLRRQVKKISNTNGQESIVLKNGASLQFVARSKSSGRGFSVDTLVLDEAQELSDVVWAAILPTISASPNPQTILLGTPPGPETNGEVFERLRDAALTGDNPRLAWMEWSAERDADPSDPETWAQANPALGIRLEEETIADEFATMDEETFGRERLGQWDGIASNAVIDEDTWHDLRSETDPSGTVAFAIDVSPDRKRASIGVAGFIDGERVMVQAIENRAGTGWVVGRIKELTERWNASAVVIDAGGPAASLLPDLKKAHVKRVRVISTREVAQACGSFYDAAVQGRLAHPDQPVLNEALAAARKRPLGDAWAWHRKDATTDITPLVAVTFAAFGLATGRKAPSGGARRVIVL